MSVIMYHQGMVHPWAGNGEDGLEMWRLAANILDKQSRTANKV